MFGFNNRFGHLGWNPRAGIVPASGGIPPWSLDISALSVTATKDITTDVIVGSNAAGDVSSDGLNIYYSNNTADRVYQFTASTPYDLSTFALSGVSTTGQFVNTYVGGLCISSDGTRMYSTFGAALTNQIRMYQYTLSTPWDITTLTNSGGAINRTVTGARQTYAIKISPDGTRAYFMGLDSSATANFITQMELGTPYDLTSVTSHTTVDPFTATGLLGNTTFAYGCFNFSADGTRFFTAQSDSGTVYMTEIEIATPWDILSARTQVNRMALSAFSNAGFALTESNNSVFAFGSDEVIRKYS